MKRFPVPMILALVLAVMAGRATAQTAAKPTPKPPYLAAVPDYGHWTVTFKYEEATAPDGTKTAPVSDALPKIIDTIKTGDLRGVVVTFPNGASQQFTFQGDWVLTSTPGGPQLSSASATHPPYPFFTTSFVLLDGVSINSSTFKEFTTYAGTAAFHYWSAETDVWIDPATMLPMAAKRGDIEVAYQFLAPPPRPFVIPKDQESLMKKETDAEHKTRSLR